MTSRKHSYPDTSLPQRRTVQIPMARSLARRYGHAAAARYLRKRGWSLESALFILVGNFPEGAGISTTNAKEV